MSLCPFATKKLLPENQNQPRIKPRAIIAHSAGGQAELYEWWMSDQSRGLESHFWISQATGEIVQYIDTEVRADANGEANGYAISIETSSTPHASEPWSDKGLASLIKLMDWLCTEHKIPRVIMATPTSSGLGWHVMFGAPGPWTQVRGKVCPGPARIEQFKKIVVPTLAKGNISTSNGELKMDAEVKKAFDAINARLAKIEAGIIGDEASDNKEAARDKRSDEINLAHLRAIAEALKISREDIIKHDPQNKKD